MQANLDILTVKPEKKKKKYEEEEEEEEEERLRRQRCGGGTRPSKFNWYISLYKRQCLC